MKLNLCFIHKTTTDSLLQQVSEYMEFWFLLLEFSKYTLLIKNLMTCQTEIGYDGAS